MVRKVDSKEQELLKFKTELKRVPVKNIEPNPYNPREPRGRKNVQDLKDSIRTVGILVPLVTIQKKRTSDRYVLIEGERRWRACKELYEETGDERFAEVPVNILKAPLEDFENILTMFNVHTKRRKWARAAEAEAIGKLMRMDATKTSNTAKLANLTGLKQVRVEEDRTILRFPRDLRDLAFNGKIGQYYLILLGRNLKALEHALPRIFDRYNWEDISRVLIKKVLSRRIRRSRDFNKLSSLAKTCIEYKNEDTFLRAFNQLMTNQDFDINDMTAFVDRELGYRVNESFRLLSKQFLESLSAHARYRNYELDKSVYEILSQIGQLIAKVKVV